MVNNLILCTRKKNITNVQSFFTIDFCLSVTCSISQNNFGTLYTVNVLEIISLNSSLIHHLSISSCIFAWLLFNVQRAVFQVYSGREQSSTIYKTTPVYRNERRYGSTTIDCQKFGYGLQYFVVCKYACKYKKGCTLTEINRFITTNTPITVSGWNNKCRNIIEIRITFDVWHLKFCYHMNYNRLVLVRGNIFVYKIITYTQTKATTYPFHRKTLRQN